MAGTKEGGKAAAKKNRELYGEDYYANIGRKGGSVLTPKGFALNRELAKKAGAIGGSRSRRGSKRNG
jgi:general stress protein YciG